jgi:hypothetical protein
VAKEVQLCSKEGCERPAAFRTTSNPAWCEECLTVILADVDLEPLAAFPGPKNWWLTRCRTCKAECHYRLVTLLEKRALNVTGCKRCDWAAWAQVNGDNSPAVGVDTLRQLLDEHGFDPVGELTPLPSGHAVLTKCRACGVQAAMQLADVSAWGCHCTRVTRSGGIGTRKEDGEKRGAKNLFVDSESAALAWWDHEANQESELKTVTVKATREANWICPDCDNRFPEKVFIMAQSPRCPACLELKRAEYERLRTVPVSEVPALLIAWDDEDADPGEVMVAGSGTLRRFMCPAGHRPRMNPYGYLTDGCSICRGLATRKKNGRQTLASALPEIAAQWHPTRNGNKVTPESIGPGSTKPFWWKAGCCGHEWEDSVRNRDKYQRWRCPACKTILHSFGCRDPGLAAEWSPENTTTPWHLRPFAETPFLPKWICAVNSEHRWEAPLASRSSGADCPECRVAGKSKVELDHFESAKKVFSKVRSGIAVRDKAFATRTVWTVDILAEHDGTKIAIEYDGAYWHRPEAKILVDRSKSLDLLAAGYFVVRLREDDLPSLNIDDPRYVELRVYSTAPQPQKMIAEVNQWGRDVVVIRD